MPSELSSADEHVIVDWVLNNMIEFVDEINLGEVKRKCKTLKRLSGKVIEHGYTNTSEGVLGLAEIVLVTSHYHPKLELKARWYFFGRRLSKMGHDLKAVVTAVLNQVQGKIPDFLVESR